VTNCAPALALLVRHNDTLSQVVKVMAECGYNGAPFTVGVQQFMGASVEIAKRYELHADAVMSKRWVVECSFAWMEKCRRLWKTCVRNLNTSLQFVLLAFVELLLRRYRSGYYLALNKLAFRGEQAQLCHAWP
jgi:transposase